jgi:phosphatidylserine decarboxylase
MSKSYFDLLSNTSTARAVTQVAESNRIFASRDARHESELDPSVQALRDVVREPRNEFLRIYIGRMLDQANQQSPLNIKTADDFFRQLDNALHSYPQYDAQFIAALPFYAALKPFMANQYGYFLFTNEQLRPYFAEILRVYHRNLALPASLVYLNDSYGNWLSAEARTVLDLDASVYDPSRPHGGFKSWNDFFIRPFKDIASARPIAPDVTPQDIVSPVDGQVWMISRQVQAAAAFEIKGEQYYLSDLLDESADSPALAPFIDGLAMQILLLPFNYHRWHAPVSGRVTQVKTVPGLFFAAPAPDQDYAVSFPFLSHVNTRTIVVIEPHNPRIGKIAMVFVGLTEVSSCKAIVAVGDAVVQGAEIGHYAFGGSTCCVLFEKAKIAQLYVSEKNDQTGTPEPGALPSGVLVRQTIATAL